jgi:hypothetical protein
MKNISLYQDLQNLSVLLKVKYEDNVFIEDRFCRNLADSVFGIIGKKNINHH